MQAAISYLPKGKKKRPKHTDGLLYDLARNIEFLIARAGLSRFEVWNMTPREIGAHCELAQRRIIGERLDATSDHAFGHMRATVSDKRDVARLERITKQMTEYSE